MSDPLASIYQAMRADTDLVRLIADNIANAQTSGYQRKFGIQQASFASLETAANSTTVPAMPATFDIGMDATPGTLSETREPLDVALNGPGSLVAIGYAGEQQVRGGRLHVDDQGFLVTQAGLRMQGVSGPINLGGATVDMSTLKIARDGTLSIGGVDMGQLLVRTASDAEDAALPQVMQGYAETSNVDAVTEMLKLMEIIRHFETTQKVVRSYGDLQQQGIADIGKV